MAAAGTRTLFVFALFLLASLPSQAAIAYVAASHTACVQSSASTATETCTLAAPTTAGDDIVIGVAWKNAAATVLSVAGSAPNSWFSLYATTCNGANDCVATLLCHQCVAQTAVTTTMSTGTPFVTLVEEYSGVAAIGITGAKTATSATPGLTITTGDANDWTICATASPATAGIPTASTGNLRSANSTGTTSADVAGAVIDNTAAAPGSLACTATIASGAWAATAVELRSAAPRTWIWPDCDTTHPCVVHHIDTVSDGTAYGETLQGFKFPMVPSSPGNLLVFTVTHVSTKTITVTDNNSGAWQTAITTTNATDGEETELLYLCGAAPGTNLITIQLSQPAATGEVLQFSYSEISGIAPSACLDGASAANGLTASVQPGAITASAAGDLNYNFGEESYPYPEQDDPIGWVMPDDNSALMMENTYDKFANQVSIQAEAGAYNPTLYVNADPNRRNWNSVAAAFKASSGAGTQPSGVHVTRILHYINAFVTPVSVPFPASGNAVVLSTSNPSSGGWDMANLADNFGHTYARTPFSNAGTDPQQYSTCLGSTAGSRDLTINWLHSSDNTHLLLYEIAGAVTTGGSTGCIGATVNTITGNQPSTINASITGDPVITPDAVGSVVIATSYFGTGPPSASLTPNVVFNSVFATGMIDSSSWDTGDPFAYIYTTSTSPISFNWQMANSTGLANGGTYFDGAAIEILGNQLTSIAVTPTNPTVAVGATQQFAATGTYSDGSTQDITASAAWSSSLPATAIITPVGVATGVCAGSSIISAAMSNLTGLTTLTVTGLGNSTTALSSSANPAQPTHSITFTATVSSPCGTPTGTVQFVIDGANYGAPGQLDATGSASISATLSPGNHSISVTYSGSAAFTVSASNTLSETVVPFSTTTTLTASANQIAQGASVTLTATVAAAGSATTPTGSVGFYNGPTLLGTSALNQGTATLATTTLPAGTDSPTAAYTASGAFAASTSGPVTVVVNNALVNTTTTLVASPTQVNTGTAVTLTATVAVASGTNVPTGAVSFYNGTALLGSSNLSGGVAGFTTSSLPAGSDSLTASYAGNSSLNPSVSNPVTITVTASPVATSTLLAIAPGGGSLTAGSSFTLTATVSPATGTTIPTGNVVFKIATNTYTAALNAVGVATYTGNTPLITGTLAISATYQGSAAFSASTSNTLNETIIPIPTTTTLTASATQITQESPVTLTASVTAPGSAIIPTASVNFYNGTTLLGTVPLTNGVATLATTSLPAGADSITATYEGATGFAVSTSSTITITVTGTSNPVPVISGISPPLVLAGNAAFAFTVSGSQFTSASTIYWGATALATQFVSATVLNAQVLAADVASAGIASITVQTPAPGGGTSNTFQFEIDSASSSVTPPSFTPANASIAPGSSASYTVTLPSTATNPSASCLNLSAGVTCSYSATTGVLTVATPSTTPAGTYLITVVFTETLPVSSAFVFLPFLLLPLRSIQRRRSSRGLWLTTSLLLLLATGVGCSGGGSQSTSTPPPPQTHQLTSSGVVTLTVQ